MSSIFPCVVHRPEDRKPPSKAKQTRRQLQNQKLALSYFAANPAEVASWEYFQRTRMEAAEPGTRLWLIDFSGWLADGTGRRDGVCVVYANGELNALDEAAELIFLDDTPESEYFPRFINARLGYIACYPLSDPAMYHAYDWSALRILQDRFRAGHLLYSPLNVVGVTIDMMPYLSKSNNTNEGKDAGNANH